MISLVSAPPPISRHASGLCVVLDSSQSLDMVHFQVRKMAGAAARCAGLHGRDLAGNCRLSKVPLTASLQFIRMRRDAAPSAPEGQSPGGFSTQAPNVTSTLVISAIIRAVGIVLGGPSNRAYLRTPRLGIKRNGHSSCISKGPGDRWQPQ